MIFKVIIFINLLFLVSVSSLETRRQLRVEIYKDIPDLNGDNLTTLLSWIEETFEKEYTEIDLQVETHSKNVYDIGELEDLFVEDDDAPHIVELDTILLGEIVEKGLIAKIDPERYGLLDPGAYKKFALEAVNYEEYYYGIPTLLCGNYLVGINVGKAFDICPVHHTEYFGYFGLDTLLSYCKTEMLSAPRTITLAGNFMGSWTLPNFYIDAYIDYHYDATVYDAINSEIESEINVIAKMRSFIDYCREDNGRNKCYDETFRDPNKLASALIANTAIVSYGYSELIYNMA